MKLLVWGVIAAVMILAQGCSPEAHVWDQPDSLESGRINLSSNAAFMTAPTGFIEEKKLLDKEYDDFFQVSPRHSLSFGLTNHDIWIRLDLSAAADKTDTLHSHELYLNNSGLSEVTFYIPRESDTEEYYQVLHRGPSAGRGGPQDDRLFPGIIVPEDAAADLPLFIQINTYTTANFQVFLEDTSSYQNRTVHLLTLLVFLLGIIASIVVYNLIIFASIRQRPYVLYSIYGLLLIAYLVDVTGLIHILAPRMIYSPSISGILIAFPLAAVYLAFVWNFLNIPHHSPRLLYLYIGAWASCALGVMLVLAGAVFIANMLAFILTGSISLLILFSLLLCYQRGFWVSRFYLIAVLFLMGSLLIYILRGVGAVEHSFFTSYGVYVFATLEAMFISFALAAHFRKLYQDNISLAKNEKEYYRKWLEAESASSAKSAFLSRMSHELRTPLNGIIGFTDILTRTPLKRVQHKYVENISLSASSLMNIVNDILDVSKIEAGKMQLEYMLCDITEIVETAVDLLNFHASQKQLELILSIEPDLPRNALIDPLRLKQVLVNLISNAVKFTNSGEIEVSLSFRPTESGKGIYNFSVRDTGIGISDEQKSKIFENFAQGDETVTRRFGGTGLGLVIVNNLIKMMGAELKLSSSLGNGTNFFFSLAAEVKEEPRYIQQTLEQGMTVIIADDHKHTLKMLEKSLITSGAEVTTFNSREELLEGLNCVKNYPMLILNLHMSGSSGIEALRYIRITMGLTAQHLPVCVLHHALDDENIFEQCDSLDVHFHLTKPVRTWELIQCIANTKAGNASEVKHGSSREKKMHGPITQKPLRIIVAEDLQLNLMLLRENLKYYLPQAEIYEAYNGREVIRLYSSAAPELILMDIQMPEVNGLQAAEEIRQLEQQTGAHVPIISISASAFKEEELRCREAGMDEFISKPIDQQKLRNVLTKFLPNDLRSGTETIEADTKPGLFHTPETVLTGIDYEEAMERFHEKKDLFKDMLMSFAAEYRTMPQRIRVLLESGEHAQAIEQLHAFRGLTSNLSATKLYHISSSIFRDLQKPAAARDNILLQITELEKEMEKLHYSVRQLTGD